MPQIDESGYFLCTSIFATAAPRISLAFHSDSSSWLNQIERFFAEITEPDSGVLSLVVRLNAAVDLLPGHQTGHRDDHWLTIRDDYGLGQSGLSPDAGLVKLVTSDADLEKARSIPANTAEIGTPSRAW
jgi:hypothetical protein